jgi:transposase InsO family protein
MPWQEASTMSLRQEFVMLATAVGANRALLCRRFGISRKTGYKWLDRAREDAALGDQSRRPHASPTRTGTAVETAILELRDEHPSWGARKLRRRLENLGWTDLPSPSTVQTILLRHGRIDPAQSMQHTAWQRFEHEAPNALWQMDFKGHFAVGASPCHPLTMLDDHSRYNLCLQACPDQRGTTVQGHLSGVFGRYGLPQRMAMDNGPPWGDTPEHPYTPLVAWLIRLGVRVTHSRPRHPQTLGKEERFHRTLKAEVLRQPFTDMNALQRRFDRWRHTYNFERPHESIGMQPPASRYVPSARSMPEQLPAIEYASADIVRRVQVKGYICYRGRHWSVGKAFAGYPVALRPTITDGLFDVYFCHQKVSQIDLVTG